MDEQEAIYLIRKVLDVVQDSVPVDCQDLISNIKNKLLKEIRDQGLEKILEDWEKDKDDVELIIS